MKSIAAYAPTFFGYIISDLASVCRINFNLVMKLVSPEYRISKDFYPGRIKCFTKNQLGLITISSVN